MRPRNPPPRTAPTRRLQLGGALAMLATGAGAGPRPPRILAFGDSLTAGYGLPRGKGLVPVLSRRLAQQGRPAILLDGGLSGDTSYGGRVRIGWSLRRGVDAVIVQLGGNDMLSGIPAARAEANFDAILTRAGQGGRPVLLVGIRTPEDHPQRAEWAALWPRLAARHGCLLLADLYAPLAAIPAGDRAPYLLADGVHPSAQGVELIAEALMPRVLALLAMLDPGPARPPGRRLSG